jgi:long-chain fatty acid transport protein
MNLFNKKTLVALSAATGCLVSLSAYSAGLEKNVNWSGKYNGVAGAATSSVSDSEGLFFNPAGLAGVEGKGDVHVNFSPTFSQFEGPVTANDQQKKSVQSFSPLGGITSAYRLDDSTVLGGGVFVSGGTKARYENIDGIGGVGQSSLSIIEGTVGAAKKINENFSIGASWRISYASAELATIQTIAGPGILHIEFRDLSTWNFTGFRVGAQYQADKLSFGLNIRTPLNVKLKGDTATGENTNPIIKKDSDTTVSATFPWALSLGADYAVDSKLRLLSDLSYTNYAANKNLEIISGTLGDVSRTLNWHDLYIARLGAEYKIQDNLVLRGGYALISAVTNKDFANATYSSPGLGHSLTLGAGSKFGNLDANAALDYSFASGHSDGNGASALSGDYKSHSYTAHLGVAYSY